MRKLTIIWLIAIVTFLIVAFITLHPKIKQWEREAESRTSPLIKRVPAWR